MCALLLSVLSSSSWLDVSLHLDQENEAVNIRAEARTTAGTGVEMEALTGAHLPADCQGSSTSHTCLQPLQLLR